MVLDFREGYHGIVAASSEIYGFYHGHSLVNAVEYGIPAIQLSYNFSV